MSIGTLHSDKNEVWQELMENVDLQFVFIVFYQYQCMKRMTKTNLADDISSLLVKCSRILSQKKGDYMGEDVEITRENVKDHLGTEIAVAYHIVDRIMLMGNECGYSQSHLFPPLISEIDSIMWLYGIPHLSPSEVVNRGYESESGRKTMEIIVEGPLKTFAKSLGLVGCPAISGDSQEFAKSLGLVGCPAISGDSQEFAKSLLAAHRDCDFLRALSYFIVAINRKLKDIVYSAAATSFLFGKTKEEDEIAEKYTKVWEELEDSQEILDLALSTTWYRLSCSSLCIVRS